MQRADFLPDTKYIIHTHRCSGFQYVSVFSKMSFNKDLYYSSFLKEGESNMLNCDIIVSKFELQSHCYAHFGTNTLRKGMNHPYPPQVCVK